MPKYGGEGVKPEGVPAMNKRDGTEPMMPSPPLQAMPPLASRWAKAIRPMITA
jgi:hypothetical protein